MRTRLPAVQDRPQECRPGREPVTDSEFVSVKSSVSVGPILNTYAVCWRPDFQKTPRERAWGGCPGIFQEYCRTRPRQRWVRQSGAQQVRLPQLYLKSVCCVRFH